MGRSVGQADTYELTAQLRNRGYAVCIWTYEDVLDECGGDRNKAEAFPDHGEDDEED